MYWVKLMCCTYIGYSVCVSIFLPIKQHEACLNWKDSKKSQCKLIQSNKTNKLNQDWDSSDVKKLCIYNGSDCLFCCRLFFGDVRALMLICNMQIFVQVYSNVWWNCEIVNKWLMKVYTLLHTYVLNRRKKLTWILTSQETCSQPFTDDGKQTFWLWWKFIISHLNLIWAYIYSFHFKFRTTSIANRRRPINCGIFFRCWWDFMRANS